MIKLIEGLIGFVYITATALLIFLSLYFLSCAASAGWHSGEKWSVTSRPLEGE